MILLWSVGFVFLLRNTNQTGDTLAFGRTGRDQGDGASLFS